MPDAVVHIADASDPPATITAAALPVVAEWIAHVARGEPFALRRIDARSVYRVCERYRALSDLPPD